MNRAKQFSDTTLLAPYLHKFSAMVQIINLFWCFLGNILIKFGAAASSGAIWDEFNEQHYHQSIKVALNFMLN